MGRVPAPPNGKPLPGLTLQKPPLLPVQRQMELPAQIIMCKAGGMLRRAAAAAGSRRGRKVETPGRQLTVGKGSGQTAVNPPQPASAAGIPSHPERSFCPPLTPAGSGGAAGGRQPFRRAVKLNAPPALRRRTAAVRRWRLARPGAAGPPVWQQEAAVPVLPGRMAAVQWWRKAAFPPPEVAPAFHPPRKSNIQPWLYGRRSPDVPGAVPPPDQPTGCPVYTGLRPSSRWQFALTAVCPSA